MAKGLAIGFLFVVVLFGLLFVLNTEDAKGLRKVAKTVSSEKGSIFYSSLQDLTDEERYPRKGSRHMVDPPKGGKITLVHCDTTAGPWSIAVHHKWAPLGAQRFMEMVKTNYFSNQVPLMRCVKHFLCQFGLAGEFSKQFGKSIQDDPNWLPEGREHWTNEEGVSRFALGYMAYAGAGKNSRGNQLIIANHPNKWLAGGSPWEVPWGEIVGKHSFDTLAKIYTGYGEKGPGQGKLHKAGHVEWVKRDFPKLDFVTACQVMDEETQPEN